MMTFKALITFLIRILIVLILLAAITLSAAIVLAGDASVALAHWEKDGGKDPQLRYLSLENVTPAIVKQWDAALKFAVPSASRAELLDYQIPRRLTGSTAYFIDLEHLQWAKADLDKVLEKYPYEVIDPQHFLLTIRGDWLLNELADPRTSQALYLLLYGVDSIPKTDVDFVKFWGVDENQQTGQQFGWVETNSQVNKTRTRFVERFNARGLSLWRTKDSKIVTNDKDPLETLNGNFKHDGRELIAQFMKTSLRQKSRGAAQAYLLANGQGAIAQEAPVDLVEDHKRTFGQAAIVNHSSCIICHDHGMQLPTENGLERLLKEGVTLKAFAKKQQEGIESFHLTDVLLQLNRDRENYEIFVKACNGLTGVQNAEAYKLVLDDYRADVTLEQAAKEQKTNAEDLKLALAYASANNIVIGNRLSGLAHGIAVSRDQWEDDYLRVRGVLKAWRAHIPNQGAKK